MNNRDYKELTDLNTTLVNNINNINNNDNQGTASFAPLDSKPADSINNVNHVNEMKRTLLSDNNDHFESFTNSDLEIDEIDSDTEDTVIFYDHEDDLKQNKTPEQKPSWNFYTDLKLSTQKSLAALEGKSGCYPSFKKTILQRILEAEEYYEAAEQKRRDDMKRQEELGVSTKEYLFNEEQKRMPGKRGTFAAQLFIGISRDLTWRLQYTDGLNDKLGSFFGPTLSQMYTTLVPVLFTARISMECGAPKHGTFFLYNRRQWMNKILILALASWSAILPWNAAQQLGLYLGEKLLLDLLSSKYFAGLFTGIIEALWQNALVIPLLSGNPRDKWDIFLNSVPGAVWQWIDTALSDPDDPSVDAFKVGAAIAASVAFSTWLMTCSARKVNRCLGNTTADNLPPEAKVTNITIVLIAPIKPNKTKPATLNTQAQTTTEEKKVSGTANPHDNDEKTIELTTITTEEVSPAGHRNTLFTTSAQPLNQPLITPNPSATRFGWLGNCSIQ